MSKGTLRLRVIGIDHVVLHVRDLARARKFYVELLGMEVHRENPRQLFLKCGSQIVALFEVPKGTRLRAGSEMNHLALRIISGRHGEVKDALRKAGIKVTPFRRGHPHCIYFNDPDSHRLQLLTPVVNNNDAQ